MTRGMALNAKGPRADEIIIILSVSDERLMMNHLLANSKQHLSLIGMNFLQNSDEHLFER